jgi:hypothetical protein
MQLAVLSAQEPEAPKEKNYRQVGAAAGCLLCAWGLPCMTCPQLDSIHSHSSRVYHSSPGLMVCPKGLHGSASDSHLLRTPAFHGGLCSLRVIWCAPVLHLITEPLPASVAADGVCLLAEEHVHEG